MMAEPMQIIDPEIVTARELATHANDIMHLQDDMDKLVKDMDDIKKAIQSIQQTLSEARGGWRMMIGLGSGAAFIGGLVGWVIERFWK